jgi:hypothetical protein
MAQDQKNYQPHSREEDQLLSTHMELHPLIPIAFAMAMWTF